MNPKGLFALIKDPRSKNIIWTVDNICDYLDISQALFYRLVEHGMPAAIIEGKWCAHAENLEHFFRAATSKRHKKADKAAK